MRCVEIRCRRAVALRPELHPAETDAAILSREWRSSAPRRKRTDVGYATADNTDSDLDRGKADTPPRRTDRVIIDVTEDVNRAVNTEDC